MYVRLNLCHIDFVAAQSKFVSDAFYKKYNFSKVKVLPFYRSCPKISTPINREYDFCYISLAHAHKNHNNLLDALKVLAAKNVKLSIALTVEKDKVNLIKKIKAINKMGSVNIYNYGLVSKNSVCEIYSKTRCLVYPSIEESFGLSLVEAVDKGLDVIASRLQYVYEVIEPSLVFDPFSSLDMAAKIEQYINTGSKRSYSKTQNKIVDLIELVLVKQP